MGRFLAGRIAQAVPTLIIVSLAVFFLMRLIPGDPAAVMLGDLATPDQVEAMRQSMGVSGPLARQYWVWISAILSGDFGK